MIQIKELKKAYRNSNVVTEVLRGVNLHVEQGEFVAIMGSSGSGKSTLLNIIGGMDRADSGSYCFEGEEVLEMHGKRLAEFRNKNVGFVFQIFHLLPEFDVADNIALPLGYAKVGAKERRRRAEELLEKIGLSSKAQRRPNQLSGGEQQRVAIARAIANHPKVLLADEPTGSLDQENGLQVLQMMKDLNQEGLTLIVVTHDPGVASFANRVIQGAELFP